jgi:hypothetical protein
MHRSACVRFEPMELVIPDRDRVRDHHQDRVLPNVPPIARLSRVVVVHIRSVSHVLGSMLGVDFRGGAPASTLRKTVRGGTLRV